MSQRGHKVLEEAHLCISLRDVLCSAGALMSHRVLVFVAKHILGRNNCGEVAGSDPPGWHK